MLTQPCCLDSVVQPSNGVSMSRHFQVTFDAYDPRALSSFWRDVLGYVHSGPPGVDLADDADPLAAWDEFLARVGIPSEERNTRSAIEDPEGRSPSPKRPAVLPVPKRSGRYCAPLGFPYVCLLSAVNFAGSRACARWFGVSEVCAVVPANGLASTKWPGTLLGW